MVPGPAQVRKPMSKSEDLLRFYAEYVGDDLYDPVWAELNRRKTVVFLHGSQVTSDPDPHPFLCVPISQVPVKFITPSFKYTVDES